MVIDQILFFGISEFVLLLGYVIFAYFVTRKADFYKARRWRAAILISVISGFLITALICIPLLLSSYDTSTKSIILNFDSMIATVICALAFVIPFMFLITVTSYSRLAWSDYLLDKLWKDPNEGKKSPIQPF